MIQQIMKSGNPTQMLMNMMNPQQKAMAQAFLNNPNREQALQQLMHQHNVSQEQVDSIKKMIIN